MRGFHKDAEDSIQCFLRLRVEYMTQVKPVRLHLRDSALTLSFKHPFKNLCGFLPADSYYGNPAFSGRRGNRCDCVLIGKINLGHVLILTYTELNRLEPNGFTNLIEKFLRCCSIIFPTTVDLKGRF